MKSTADEQLPDPSHPACATIEVITNISKAKDGASCIRPRGLLIIRLLVVLLNHRFYVFVDYNSSGYLSVL